MRVNTADNAIGMPKLSGGESKFARFCNSDLFIWVIAAITCLFWALKLDIEGIAFLLMLITLVLFFCKDATPVITIFIFFFFVFSDSGIKLEGREPWLLLLIPPFVGFVYNLVRFRGKSFKLKGFSFSLLVCLIPWLLQGITRSGRKPIEALLCAGIAVAFVLAYFCMYAASRRDGKEMTGYIAKVLLVLGVLICVQILIFYLREGDYSFDDFMVKLGWGTRNPVAAILSLVMPVPFYFATKKGKFNFLFLLLGYFEYIVILLIQSRGATLFSTLAIPVLAIYSFCCGENKKANLAVNVILLAVVAGLAIFKIDVLKALFYRLYHSGLDDSGRSVLFAAGIEAFLRYPVFGAGFDYRAEIYYQFIFNSTGPTYYHSTVIQIAACLGVIGLISYLYLYYWRYRVAATDLNSVKFVILVGMAVFECYCFIDTVYFQPMGYFLLMCISLCMEKGLSSKQTEPSLIKAFRKFKPDSRKNLHN